MDDEEHVKRVVTQQVSIQGVPAKCDDSKIIFENSNMAPKKVGLG